MNGLSLKFRIALMIFVLEAIMLGFVLWQTLAQTQSGIRIQLEANEQAMLDLMGGMSRVALLTEEYADLQPYLENVVSDPRVERTVLADHAGRVVASTSPTDVGQPLREILTLPQTKRYWKQLEIGNVAGKLGNLAMEFSDEALLAAYADARNHGITIAIAGMIVIALAGVGVGVVLTRRLDQLTGAAQTIARGERATRLALHGHDEIGRLGAAFNTMIERLEEEKRKTDQAHAALEQRVEERTRELATANRELESFSYSVSHDLRAPLRALDGFSLALQEDYGAQLDEQAEHYLARIRAASQHMSKLIDALLQLSRLSRKDVSCEPLDLSELARQEMQKLAAQHPERRPQIDIQPGVSGVGDRAMLGLVLQNLLGNALKFTAQSTPGHIEFGSFMRDGRTVYFVRDDGAGFDMKYVDKLFGAFQRLHDSEVYEGTGIGLATVQRVIDRHHGEIWAEGEVDRGATFYFTLGSPETGKADIAA